MPYDVRWSAEARLDLRSLARHEQVIAESSVRQQLTDAPTSPSNKRKRLDPNPLGVAWELRLGELRVFYDVEETPIQLVRIQRVGRKVRERVVVRGTVVEMRDRGS